MTCLQRMYPTAWSSPTRHFVIAVKACKASVNAKQGHVTLLRAGEPNSQRDCKITDGVDSSLDYLQPEHNPRQFNAYIGILLLLRTYGSCVLQLHNVQHFHAMRRGPLLCSVECFAILSSLYHKPHYMAISAKLHVHHIYCLCILYGIKVLNRNPCLLPTRAEGPALAWPTGLT